MRHSLVGFCVTHCIPLYPGLSIHPPHLLQSLILTNSNKAWFTCLQERPIDRLPSSLEMSGQQLTTPALYLYPLNHTFDPKHIALILRQRVKIGRQTNGKTVPAERNGYFHSQALSRQHAEVWEQDGKVIATSSSRSGTRG